MTEPAHERACENCGVTFWTNRPLARFHSDACRAAWHRAHPAPDDVDRLMAAVAKIRRRRPARRSGAPRA